MKKFFAIAVIMQFMTVASALAQLTTGFYMNYQTVLRNTDGSPITSQVAFKFTLRQETATGAIVYEEVHSVLPNDRGQVSLKIGQGLALNGGDFDNIDWLAAKYFLEIGLDPSAGFNFETMGTEEIASSPRAIVADTAAVAGQVQWEGVINRPTDISALTNETGLDLDPSNELQSISISGNALSLSNGGGSVTLPSGSVVALDQSNFNSISLSDHDMVNVTGIIDLTGITTYNKLSYNDGLVVNGGLFRGVAGSETTIDVSTKTTFVNVTFENVRIDGSDLSFIGCTFDGVIELGLDSKLSNCDLNNVDNDPFDSFIASIVGGEIRNSNLPRVDVVTGVSYLKNTVLESSVVAGCAIYDCQISMVGDYSLTGNKVSDSRINLVAGRDGIVSGNQFNGLYSGADAIIYLDVNSGTITAANISGNTFSGNSAPNQYISIAGNFTGSYFALKVSDNLFVRGVSAISNQATGINMVVANNTLKSAVIGVSNGGTIIVRDNDAF